MNTPGSTHIDLGTLESRDRPHAVFRALDALPRGGSLTLSSSHDPRPLRYMRYQLVAQRPHAFDYAYESEGPAIWRLRIQRR